MRESRELFIIKKKKENIFVRWLGETHTEKKKKNETTQTARCTTLWCDCVSPKLGTEEHRGCSVGLPNTTALLAEDSSPLV